MVDPRASAVGHIAAAFKQYLHIGKVLPALGYLQSQLDDLRATINGSRADVVISGTPSDITRLIFIDKPVVRARYEFVEVDTPRLDQRLVDAYWDDCGIFHFGEPEQSGHGSLHPTPVSQPLLCSHHPSGLV